MRCRPGSTSCVVLGAGLDTFAYRSPYDGLRVVEVDHPATAGLEAEGSPAPGSTCRRRSCTPRWTSSATTRWRSSADGVDLDRPVLFWWLGVTPYLTREAVETTLRRWVAAPAAVVLDHAAPAAATLAGAGQHACAAGARRSPGSASRGSASTRIPSLPTCSTDAASPTCGPSPRVP